ncbi:MAG: YqgE/AlgH family protein, partial [Rhodospirillales bacterium]|nr:YqgE/AlgH family protein [Rhodospirillales bacterium]
MAVSAKIPRMVFRHVLYMAVFALFAVGVQPSAGQAADEPAKGSNFLTGKLLVASPKMADPRFAETVIFMVNHDAKGAFGLIVNRSYGKGPMQSFLKGFGIEAEQAGGDIRIHYGGPVEPERGFILHTDDFKDPTTVDIDGGYSLT